MAQGQRAGEARGQTAISAAPCGSAPTRRCSSRGSRIADIYGATEISERHRHRYEVNTAYKGRLEQHGMRFCGMSPDGVLPEIIEYADHPWFIGVQFHPELKSRPFEPHPLFASFIGGGGAEPAGVIATPLLGLYLTCSCTRQQLIERPGPAVACQQHWEDQEVAWRPPDDAAISVR